MVESDFIFNVITYALVIAYILYINFAAHLNKNTGFLNSLINLFQNWIFRLVFLLVVGFFSLDMFPHGGFILAILLTIAFLNTNMLSYKKNVAENFSSMENFGFAKVINYGEKDPNEGKTDAQISSDNYMEAIRLQNKQDNKQSNDNGEGDYEDDYGDDYVDDGGDDGGDNEKHFVDSESIEVKQVKNKSKMLAKNCGPYAPLQRLPFNPHGYADDSIINTGYDVLPMDSVSRGDWTDSSVGYKFGKA